jgi:hypothetical protein
MQNFFFLIIVPALLMLTTAGGAEKLMGAPVILETFDTSPLLTFPPHWHARQDKDIARQIYRVTEENGNRFLRAHARNRGIEVGLVKVFRAQETPVLRWRWRALQLPPGANEGVDATNDSAAGVWVIFDNRVLPRALKYVWSTTQPIGTRLTNPGYWRAKTIVLRSGLEHLGTWQAETVNIYQDYKAFFGEEPGEVHGIAVKTSSDSTQSVAVADYDDFTLHSIEMPRSENAGDIRH